MYAVRHGHKDIARLLVEQKRTVNTPIGVAQMYEATSECMTINHVGPGGKTALSLAAMCGHSCIVEVLLNRGGLDVNRADQNGNFPLLYPMLDLRSIFCLTAFSYSALFPTRCFSKMGVWGTPLSCSEKENRWS